MPDNSTCGEGKAAAQPAGGGATRPRRILVSGASGLVGSALRSRWRERGDHVVAMVRRVTEAGASEVYWNPAGHEIDRKAMEGADVVVHLAGESIAAGRWTNSRKMAIRQSRVEGTRLIAEALAQLESSPGVFVSASAVGYYGDRGDEEVDETSSPGKGFLAEVCREWEAATEPARQAGIRVVNLRLGVVLSANGGALARMLTPFRLGMGGVLGSGRQYVSWIGLTDLVRCVSHVICAEGVSGPVNAVAPQPVTNAEFTRILGAVLHRPTLVPMPALAVRLVFGEMGQALLLEGARVRPARLQASGFAFLHGDLESALRHELSGEEPGR